MIKGLVLQEDVTIFNMYAPKNRVTNYTRQKANKIARRNR